MTGEAPTTPGGSRPPTARTPGGGFAPYLVPYLAFLILVEITARVPAAAEPWMIFARVAVPLALFGLYLARGSFPELRGFRPGLGGAAQDVAFGLAVALLWMLPFVLFPSLPRGDSADGFDPGALGESMRGALLGARAVGFVLVTPFVEELFVRSFLLRYLEVFDGSRDFRDLPVGQFARRGFLLTVVYFTFSHAMWEWPVALLTGVLFNLWLYHRRHIGSLVLVHAVTNGAIYAAVVLGSGRLQDAAGQPLDLWYFL